jgi:DNA-binding response OmpR family regulator
MSGDLSWRHSITPFDPNLLFAQRKSRTFDQALKHAIALMAQGSYKGDMPKKILVVDNELRSRQLIAYLLREESYEIDEADDGVSALAILEKKHFDLMICDVVMPRLNAFDVIDYMKSRSLSTSIILITGHPYLLAEKGFGSLPCFMKPFNMYDLLHKVKEMLSK